MTSIKDLKHEFLQQERFSSRELDTLQAVQDNFESVSMLTSQKLENFPNWVRHRDLARYLFKYEIFKQILPIPGAIFECGVLYGGSLTFWLHLSEIFEPVNFSRRIYGFDTFTGFKEVTDQDRAAGEEHAKLHAEGVFNIGDTKTQLFELFSLVDKTRKIPQIPRLQVIEGDACETVPRVLAEDKSILISLLHLDFDIYKPSRVVLEACIPRMPKGAIVLFDELCFEQWPGETEAALDVLNINQREFVRCPYVPHMAYMKV